MRNHLPSSSLPIMEYLSKPLRFRWVPNPKSSLVHWRMPLLPITLQGNVTLDPTTAVWSCGSMANFCSRISSVKHRRHKLDIRKSSSKNLYVEVILIVNIWIWNKEKVSPFVHKWSFFFIKKDIVNILYHD